MKVVILLIVTGILFICSCEVKTTGNTDEKVLAKVKIINVKKGDIENTISLNGKTVYLKKNKLVSPISGYVVKMNINYGDYVAKNEVLFELETKEHRALENVPGFDNKTGIVKVKSPAGGVVADLSINETGSYITEGSTLCSIVENRNLMVRVDAPFQYNSLMKPGTSCLIKLTDQSTLKGTIFRVLPHVNETDQTQAILIKPESGRELPENLNLTVQIISEKHTNTLLVDRKALLTNETQSEFWVMKVTKSKLAIKIPVIRGLENDTLAEVISNDLHINDTVISEGAYGLPDSTSIQIEK